MFASGKDGVGKSTLAVFVGAALAMGNEKTLIIELDNGFRSIDVISGTYGKLIYDINDVLTGKVEPQRAIVKSPISENLFVMSAPYSSSQLHIEDFVRLTTSLSEEYGHVIIDTAATAGAIFSAASCAMRAILITTADPVNVRNSKIISDRLIHEYSITNTRLIINRVNQSSVQAGIVPNLDFVIDSIGAQLIGVVPETLDIALASSGIRAFVSGSPSIRVFMNIAARMNGDDVPLLIR